MIPESGKITIKSPDFPELKARTPEKSYLLLTDIGNYIRLVFDDLDLPKGSKVEVGDGTKYAMSAMSTFPRVCRICPPPLKTVIWIRGSKISLRNLFIILHLVFS